MLQVNRKLNMAWAIKGEMGTLTDIEANGMPYTLQGKWLISAFYVNELVMRLLHRHESHPELYSAYDRALSALQNQEDEQQLLRIFEKHLLASLGYGLILDHDADTGEAIDEQQDYYYRLSYGPVLQDIAGVESFRVSGKTLKALEQERFTTALTLQQAKLLLRNIINSHLGSRALGSRDLYQAYIKNSTVE